MNAHGKTLRLVVRFLLAIVSTIALGATVSGTAGATQSGGDASTNATTTILVCEAMGGKAVVYSDISANHYTVIVECKGGALDGLNCIFDEAVVDCYQTKLAPTDDTIVDVTVVIEPLPEPTQALPDIPVDVPIEEITPVVDDPTATPPTDPIVDPVVDDAVIVDPVVSDGGDTPIETPVAEDDGGKEIGPGIDLDPELIEPIVEPGEVVLL